MICKQHQNSHATCVCLFVSMPAHSPPPPFHLPCPPTHMHIITCMHKTKMHTLFLFHTHACTHAHTHTHTHTHTCASTDTPLFYRQLDHFTLSTRKSAIHSAKSTWQDWDTVRITLSSLLADWLTVCNTAL